MKYLRNLSGVLLITVLPLIAQTNQPEQKKTHRAPQPTASSPTDSERGQQVFNQNCSRCHNAPEGFSPSISGTIAMHMRTRANLSEADYKALRRFFNP